MDTGDKNDKDWLPPSQLPPRPGWAFLLLCVPILLIIEVAIVIVWGW